jgi:DNA-binding NtrC family response regulator
LLDLLPWQERAAEMPPVLVVTDPDDVDLYLEAMSRGAFDCVALPLNQRELERIASRALLERRQLLELGMTV